MSNQQMAHRGFDVARRLSIALGLVGVVLLVSHLAGQISEGYASGWTLMIGIVCCLSGLILALLFSILIRLHRIEQRIFESGGLEPIGDKGHGEPKTPPPNAVK